MADRWMLRPHVPRDARSAAIRGSTEPQPDHFVHVIILNVTLICCCCHDVYDHGPVGADLLGKQLPYGPMLAEHCILGAALSPTRHPATTPLTADEVAALATQLSQLDAWLDSCKDTPPRGYIMLKPSPVPAGGAGGGSAAAGGAGAAADTVSGDAAEAGNRKGAAAEGPQCPPGMMYDDFDPLQLRQKADKPVLEFESFDAALDEFYSKVLPLSPFLLPFARLGFRIWGRGGWTPGVGFARRWRDTARGLMYTVCVGLALWLCGPPCRFASCLSSPFLPRTTAPGMHPATGIVA